MQLLSTMCRHLRHVGEIFLVCNGWRAKTASGDRQCWGRLPFDMTSFQALPRLVKDKYQSLTLSLQRNRKR